MRRGQCGVLQWRRALTCAGRRTFDLAPALLDREGGGRAGPGIWHLRGLAGKRGRLGDAAALRKVARFASLEQEVQLQQADAKRDRSKAELHEAQAEVKLEKAEAKLEKAEAKLKEAEVKLKEAKATGTEEDVGLARRKVDFALKGVTLAQELVGAYTKQVSSLLKEPVAGPVAFSFPLVLSSP
eukprot:g328.t1